MEPTKSRFKNHLEEEMVHLQKNLYINRSDPRYYEKVIRYLDPHSPEAHYRLGQIFEKQGNMGKALYHYNECKKQYPSPYYFDSASAIHRLTPKDPAPIFDHPVIRQNNTSRPRLWRNILLLLLLLNLIVWGLFFARETIFKSVSVLKLAGVGKEITYESVDMPFIMYFAYGKPHKEIEDELYTKALELAKANRGQNIWLFGVPSMSQNPDKQAVRLTDEAQRAKAFVVAQYNTSSDQTVKIRFLNADYGSLLILTEVGANLVRTALETYISDKGNPPDTLDKLIEDYPQNYLSFIPQEIRSGTNHIVGTYNGDGGWVFDPLAKQVSDMFYPNLAELPNSQRASFERFRLVLGKNDHLLQLLSGSTLLMEKKVGLGAKGLTPEGTFAILDRVKDPKGKQPHVYGSFALGMGAIAIHGTHDPGSVGGNQSLGCIRMTNADIEELFPFIPRGTNVSIREHVQTGLTAATDWTEWNPELLFPAGAKLPNESAANQIFHWLG
jgi:tetratricopeptide (TPR) repeat protein